ncbi:MAG: SpoIIE family protein phosphatase [Crocinitomicaceae bacterium]|nr:SpoIIE family protein phosphatase [Crocinitomicaceae bacterium]
MIVTWWNKISEIGQQHCVTRHDQKVVRMLNRVSFILAIMMIVFAFSVGFFFYHPSSIYIPPAFFIAFILPLWFNHRGYILASKLFFIIIPAIMLTAVSILMGDDGGDKYFLFAISLLPLMMFKKRWVVLVFFEFNVAVFYFIAFYQMHHEPIIQLPSEQVEQYHLFNMLAVFTVLFFIVYYFKGDNDKYEDELQRQNEIISEKIRETEKQKLIIEQSHKEITDSINYAERIQRSLMASQNMLDENLKNYFVYFNPKEKVSGDFYWTSKLIDQRFCLVAADSTGHGVPGAIMSMLNISSLEKAVAEKLTSSDDILNFTRTKIIQTLANDGSAEGGKDGMDAVLLLFNKEKTKLEFSLANNPLWLIRQSSNTPPDADSPLPRRGAGGEDGGWGLTEYHPDKMPVGKHDKQNIPFTKQEIDLQKGDLIYIFTDGFADQFGGEKGKKFKYSALKELLLANAEKPMEEQKLILAKTFDNWRGSLEQVDDVCVIGVRV